MDFNTQRRIIRALEKKGKNPLLFLPCLIAKIIITAVFSVCRGIDMALSDKDGNFLGIKRREKQRSCRGYEKEMAKLAARAEKMPEDFSDKEMKRLQKRLPYRPLWKRTLSAALAAAFAFMAVPAGSAGAVVVNGYVYTAPSAEQISASDINISKSDITEADFSSNYSRTSEYALNLSAGTFSEMPSLTTITLGYSDNMVIGNNNFRNIAPDYSIFVKADTSAEFADSISKIGSQNVIWDKNGAMYSQIPDDVSGFAAYSGVGKVILKWKSNNDDPDGYYIYSYTGGKYSLVQSVTADKASADDPTGEDCYLEIAGSKTETVYAIRAYKNISADYDGDDISDASAIAAGKHFNQSRAVSALTAGTPDMAKTMSNNNITVTVTMPSNASEPSYIVLYSREGTTYLPEAKFFPTDAVNGVYTYADPSPFNGTARSYIAIAYYDALDKDTTAPLASHTYIENDENDPSYTAKRSKTLDVTDAVLNSPRNPRAELSADKKLWTLSWDAPLDSANIPVTYDITINGKPHVSGVSDLYIRIATDDPNVPAGEDIVLGVTAVSPNMTSGNPATCTIDVKNRSVDFISAAAGNKRVAVTFKKFAGTTYYNINYKLSGASANERPSVVSESDCIKNSNGTLTYYVENLQNDNTYEFWITSDAPTADYRSVVISATPSDAPQPPASVTAIPGENSADIKWDIVYREGSSEPVEGYFITIKKKAGETVVNHQQIVGQNSYYATKLINDEPYYAYVTSYVTVDGAPIESVTGTVSNEFIPTVIVGDILNLSVEPQETSIKISWSAVKDATKYYLYKTDPDGKTTTFDMGKTTSYEDKAVSNNKDYTYTVKAVREVDGKPYESKVSDPKTAKINVFVGSVQNLSAVGSDGTITLKWDKTDKADGYYIEYSAVTGSSWTRIGDVSGTTYPHTGLTNGTELKYRVIAYRIINNESVTGTLEPMSITGRAGSYFPAPLDFSAVPGDGQVTLSWTAVSGAEGYEVYVVASGGTPYLLDKVSKTTAIHTNIPNGTVITYSVRAYKTVSNETVYGDYSINKTVTVGTYLNAPTDVTATAGDGTVTLKWKKSDGAEGYVVYSYNAATSSFTPVGIVTTTNFTHTGLTNGRSYTYMIAGYKTVDGKIQYSEYSLAVSAVPAGKDTGSNKDSNEGTSDYRIYITGTTPYGMSNSNVISAFAEKGAFNTDIDVRFTLSGDTVAAVQNVLNFYGEGLESFMIYPMDISLYQAGTDTPASLNPGYYLTLTIPVPDELLPYSEYISVVHVSDRDQLEILPSIHVNVGGVDCIQFTANSFSPYAFVVYLPEAGEDTSAGTYASAQGSVEYQTTSSPTFMCTYLPDIYRRRTRNKTYRIIKK